MQLVADGHANLVEVVEGLGSHHPTRHGVGDPQHQTAAAFIGKGHTVAKEVLVTEGMLGFLELDLGPFGGG